jgi:hypothetical protein
LHRHFLFSSDRIYGLSLLAWPFLCTRAVVFMIFRFSLGHLLSAAPVHLAGLIASPTHCNAQSIRLVSWSLSGRTLIFHFSGQNLAGGGARGVPATAAWLSFILGGCYPLFFNFLPVGCGIVFVGCAS